MWIWLTNPPDHINSQKHMSHFPDLVFNQNARHAFMR